MASLTEERYQQLVEYLRGSRISSPVYPPEFNANNKCGLRQQAATFGWDTVPLVKRFPEEDSSSCDGGSGRLIRACDDGIDGGHFGHNQTPSKVYTTVVDFSCPGS